MHDKIMYNSIITYYIYNGNTCLKLFNMAIVFLENFFDIFSVFSPI